MGDYYTERLTKLRGQPKKTIADYVEQYGIIVPRRFDSLQEAIASQKEILLRSEHPQDYEGISGLLDSFGLDEHFGSDIPGHKGFRPREKRSLEEVKRAYFEYQEKAAYAKFKQYCRYLALDNEEFKNQVSFTIWEKIPGFNRIVIADSAVPQRYHIMTAQEKVNFRNYVIIEDGRIIRHFGASLSARLREGIDRLIETYEAIRNLDRFDPQHCPIMEFQTHQGRNYFLQYHRTRDFSPAEFRLERETEEKEVEVPFVRGATSPEGMLCKIALYYANMLTGDFDPDHEDGSYDLHWHYVWPELMVRMRKAQMVNTNNLDFTMESFVINHTQRSKLFKPQVSILHDINVLLRDYKNFKKNGKNVYLHLHITSDGRRSFAKLCNVES